MRFMHQIKGQNMQDKKKLADEANIILNGVLCVN